MLRKLLSHAAIYGLSAQVPRLAGVLTLPIITRYLTAADYGVAGVVMAYIAAATVLHSLGLSVVLMNSFVQHPKRFKWVWRQLHGFMVVWSVVYAGLLSVILYFGIPDETGANKWIIMLLHGITALVFMNTDLVGNLFYQMSQRPLPAALRNFAIGVIVVVLNVYTIAYLKLGYMGWFYANFVGSAAGFLVYAYTLYGKEKLWPILNFKWHRIRRSFKISLPVIPDQFSYFLLETSDRLVMDVLRVPLPRIGFYNIASNFGSYFWAATMGVVQAATPFYMQLHTKSDRKAAALEARNLTFGLQALFLLVTFLICLWMKEIFLLLIANAELQGAYPLGIIILMGFSFRPMHVAATSLLVHKEKTRALWKVSFIAGLANVLLNLVFVPVYGVEAAAVTTFASLMYMGYSGFFMKEYRQFAIVSYYPLLWLAATVATLAVVYTLADVNLMVKVTITAVVLVALLATLLKYKSALTQHVKV
ncbi:lipopolysaccharide biosynthesis protein [Pontibacter ruber]|uniref:Lipopolysaccharide biosynthesis protein n=1 Tax=Pontibacter ruber TaxID=1343895 RepID=A0ABW5CUF5_9BACT|nr:lipopolysaccharide biosynthesis protein [Pontibacter ruber]